MNLDIALLLTQDGITNGAIYALLALALVLVFSVTRVIFIPQGEFVAYRRTDTRRAAGRPITRHRVSVDDRRRAGRVCRVDYRARTGAAARAVDARVERRLSARASRFAEVHPDASLADGAQIALALAIIVPMGPMVYRLAYQPLADASVLMLLIVSVAVHVVMVGLGLLVFGAEGSRTPAFSDATFDARHADRAARNALGDRLLARVDRGVQRLFDRTVYGKALRATAINRLGARLMGIPAEFAGKLSFFLAALIGAVSGILIAPITTIYYDTGFLIGLKGFVAAIIGGLASYPIAALGALLVGLIESFSSFWASAYKEVIVFTLIIPVLLWRSLRTHHVEDDE